MSTNAKASFCPDGRAVDLVLSRRLCPKSDGGLAGDFASIEIEGHQDIDRSGRRSRLGSFLPANGKTTCQRKETILGFHNPLCRLALCGSLEAGDGSANTAHTLARGVGAEAYQA
jgi:hypothetical protein